MRSPCAWLVVVVLLVVGTLLPTPSHAYERAALDGRFVADEILVQLTPTTNVRAFAKAARLLAVPDRLDQPGSEPLYRFTIADGETPPNKARRLRMNPHVQYAEPNYIGQSPEARLRSTWVVGGDTEEYVAQWALAQMRLPEAQAITAGAGITIAFLDTGVDLTHPMLREHLVAGYDFVDDDADPSEVGEADVDPAYGHGTHVAGLLALAAPQARIMPLRTLNREGRGTIWTQVQALAYAVAHGVSVINLSYSFDEPSLALADVLARITCSRGGDRLCQSIEQPGVVVVAAAGNSGLDHREYPAADSAPGVLAVGATTAADTLASFSTYGAWVTVGAPGECILSTAPGGGYATWSGTSMAAPLVAGTLALVRAHYPVLRPSEVVVRVKLAAAPMDAKVRRRTDAAAALTLVVR